MNLPDEPESPDHNSTECIICGQKHDSFKLPPQPTSQKRDPVVVSAFVIAPIAVIAMLMHLMSFAYMNRIRDSNEYGTLYVLHEIAEAEDSFRYSHRKYGTFDELIADGKLDRSWNKPLRLEYFYSVKVSENHLEISAIPMQNDLCSFLVVIEATNDKHALVYIAENGGHRAKMTDDLIGESFGNKFDWFPR
jgi:hypothetical protein